MAHSAIASGFVSISCEPARNEGCPHETRSSPRYGHICSIFGRSSEAGDLQHSTGAFGRVASTLDLTPLTELMRARLTEDGGVNGTVCRD